MGGARLVPMAEGGQVVYRREPPRAPRLCDGGTVVCLGCGPSLSRADVAYCRERATVIAVNDAYRLAPWADALMASDSAWWAHHRGVPEFVGLKVSLEKHAACWGVTVLENTGHDGIELAPTGLRDGRNSGYAAVNLAVHLGAKTIVLLGYDMDAPDGEARSHWFGAHPSPLRGGSPYALFREHFATCIEPLEQLGVRLVNASRWSALTCVPRQPLEGALP